MTRGACCREHETACFHLAHAKVVLRSDQGLVVAKGKSKVVMDPVFPSCAHVRPRANRSIATDETAKIAESKIGSFFRSWRKASGSHQLVVHSEVGALR